MTIDHARGTRRDCPRCGVKRTHLYDAGRGYHNAPVIEHRCHHGVECLEGRPNALEQEWCRGCEERVRKAWISKPAWPGYDERVVHLPVAIVWASSSRLAAASVKADSRSRMADHVFDGHDRAGFMRWRLVESCAPVRRLPSHDAPVDKHVPDMVVRVHLRARAPEWDPGPIGPLDAEVPF